MSWRNPRIGDRVKFKDELQVNLRYWLGVVALAVITIYLLVGCGNDHINHKIKYVAGDCAKSIIFHERWEKQEPIEKVVEVGKYNYRIEGENKSYRTEDIEHYDHETIKIACRKEKH